MNPKTPITFVLNEGSLVDIARIRHVLYSEPPFDEAIALLFDGQLDDGGFSPPWAPGYSSLDATCFRLYQAEQMGLDPTLLPQIGRAVDFILSQQGRDGGFQEDASVAAVVPKWLIPGDNAATMYLTANCGFALSMFNAPENKVQLAGGYLQLRQIADGSLPSFWQTQWLSAAVWHRLGGAKWRDQVLRYLALNMDQLHSSNLAWMINALLSAGMKPSTVLIYEAAKRLERAQNQYGTWAGESGDDRDMQATIDALRALNLTGRYQPPPMNQLDSLGV